MKKKATMFGVLLLGLVCSVPARATAPEPITTCAEIQHITGRTAYKYSCHTQLHEVGFYYRCDVWIDQSYPTGSYVSYTYNIYGHPLDPSDDAYCAGLCNCFSYQPDRVVDPNGCPLVLDLDGGGLKFSSVGDGVLYDITGDGAPEQTAWTVGADGFLADDRDGDGQIIKAEMFGDSSQQAAAPDGPNGFHALALYDSNGDGVISSADYFWSHLLVWIDSNRDGVAGAEELRTLNDLAVTSISLSYVSTPRHPDHNGNVIGWKASAVVDGKPVTIGDVRFAHE